MKLLIAEKPSVATGPYKDLLEKLEGESFAKRDGYLEGKNYVISWCIGHLISTADPDAYGWGWNLDQIPFVPQKWKYVVNDSTSKQYKILADLCKKAELIIAGGDAGREGQLITDLVIEHAGCQTTPQKRLWVNSFDEKSLSKAWKALKPSIEYVRLSNSAKARQKADWMVGMSLSVGYSVALEQRGLSVGRVQTPTLKIVVDRDLEIENWKDRFYFNVDGVWNRLKFKWFDNSGTEIATKERAEKIKSEINNRVGVLTSFDRQEKKNNPSKPFDLTELQKEANRKLGLKAAETLSITQELYEEKYVSYPRTDSAYLPEGMKDEAWEIIEKVASDNEKSLLKGRNENLAFFNSSKVSDHYAIIPTGVKPDGLKEKQELVYNLIRDRFVSAFMKSYIYDEFSMIIEVEKHTMKSSAILVKELGFKALNKTEESNDSEDKPNLLDKPLEFSVGQKADVNDVEVIGKKAKKPSHYTEATLLTAMNTAGKVIEDENLREAMKERGLGTPATKASIIEGLKKREYIIEKGKAIVSTAKGRSLIDIVDDRVKSPEMTGDWEYKLNQIAEGKYLSEAFLDDIENYLKTICEDIKTLDKNSFAVSVSADELDCPKCKKNKIVINKFLAKCRDEDGCGFKVWKKIAEKNLSDSQVSTLILKGKTGLIKGFKSKAGKPFDAMLKLEGDKVSFEFENKK